MRNLKIILILIIFSFNQSILAQDSNRVWLTDKISVPRERNGCFWISSSVWRREKPPDLAGFVSYGFRELIGKNILYTAHYGCLPIIEEINLSRTKVCTNFQKVDNQTENQSQKIDIIVKHTDPENDVVTYDYKVSGGIIIGRGANVIWNLSGVKPNTYTLKVCVDDGLGCEIEGAKNKQIKEVSVIECPEDK